MGMLNQPQINDIRELAGKVQLHNCRHAKADLLFVQQWVDTLAQGELTSKALALGFRAHSEAKQFRKSSEQTPYFVHPLAVSVYVDDLLKQVEISEQERQELLAAALLHDVLEDTSVTPQEIASLVGEQVLALVQDLTDVFTKEHFPELNRSARKAKEQKRIVKLGHKAILVKLADMKHNLQDIALHDPKFATVYASEKNDLLNALENSHRRDSNQSELKRVMLNEMAKLKSDLTSNQAFVKKSC